MRSIPAIAALLAWAMFQLPGVICVCDCGDMTRGSLLVHEHDHTHAHDDHHDVCGCCDHDHPHDHGHDHDHGHAHVVVHLQSSMANQAVALVAPDVDFAVQLVLPTPAAIVVAHTCAELDTGPPRPADPVSAADRLIV